MSDITHGDDVHFKEYTKILLELKTEIKGLEETPDLVQSHVNSERFKHIANIAKLSGNATYLNVNYAGKSDNYKWLCQELLVLKRTWSSISKFVQRLDTNATIDDIRRLRLEMDLLIREHRDALLLARKPISNLPIKNIPASLSILRYADKFFREISVDFDHMRGLLARVYDHLVEIEKHMIEREDYRTLKLINENTNTLVSRDSDIQQTIHMAIERLKNVTNEPDESFALDASESIMSTPVKDEASTLRSPTKSMSMIDEEVTEVSGGIEEASVNETAPTLLKVAPTSPTKSMSVMDEEITASSGGIEEAAMTETAPTLPEVTPASPTPPRSMSVIDEEITAGSGGIEEAAVTETVPALPEVTPTPPTPIPPASSESSMHETMLMDVEPMPTSPTLRKDATTKLEPMELEEPMLMPSIDEPADLMSTHSSSPETDVIEHEGDILMTDADAYHTDEISHVVDHQTPRQSSPIHIQHLQQSPVSPSDQTGNKLEPYLDNIAQHISTSSPMMQHVEPEELTMSEPSFEDAEPTLSHFTSLPSESLIEHDLISMILKRTDTSDTLLALHCARLHQRLYQTPLAPNVARSEATAKTVLNNKRAAKAPSVKLSAPSSLDLFAKPPSSKKSIFLAPGEEAFPNGFDFLKPILSTNSTRHQRFGK